jgi:hypothetical protein
MGAAAAGYVGLDISRACSGRVALRTPKNDGSVEAFVRNTLALAFNRRLHAAAFSSTVSCS